MSEQLVIPPVPEDRAAKYAWIDAVTAIGVTVKRACEMAGVPKVSYYKVHKARQSEQGPKAEARDSGMEGAA